MNKYQKSLIDFMKTGEIEIELRHLSQRQLTKLVEDLQQRIDKAIEYIKENCMFHNENNEECYCNYGDDLSPKKLVDILKGSEE